jgi:hypothetical protein
MRRPRSMIAPMKTDRDRCRNCYSEVCPIALAGNRSNLFCYHRVEDRIANAARELT